MATVAFCLLFSSLLCAQDEGPRDYLERGNSKLQDGNYAEALQILAEGLARFSDDTGLVALVDLVEVQRDEERRRLVERGLSTFFSDPGVSCRTWMRLLQIDPEDQDAARNVQVLSEKLEDDIVRLAAEGESLLEAADFTGARRVARELQDFECLYRYSEPLKQKIDDRYRDWLTEQLTSLEQRVQENQCNEALDELDELVEEPMLSRQQVARAYLLIGVCRFSNGDRELAEQPIRNALNFDPELSVPPWLPAELLTLVEALR